MDPKLVHDDLNCGLDRDIWVEMWPNLLDTSVREDRDARMDAAPARQLHAKMSMSASTDCDTVRTVPCTSYCKII